MSWFVTENDIKNWTATNKRSAEELLPLLVKKLILASSSPAQIDFPSGDSVAIGGWDGALNVESNSAFIPDGISGWEFGTNANVKPKADEDYEKRTEEPEPLDPSASTFVFVTARLWTKKDEWVSEKKVKNQWKNVMGINASVLSEWLEECPAVHRWFAQIIGKREPSVKDIEQAWSDYKYITQKELSIDFFLHDRELEISKINDFLTNGQGVFRVFSSSRAEALGFVLASIQSNEVFSSRTLIIKSQESWDFMIENKLPLVLIPFGFSPANLGAATAKNHLVISIEDQYLKDPDLTLERQPRLKREAAIKLLGFSGDEAKELYKSTRGYLEPLLRHDLLDPVDHISPKWVDKYGAEVLFTALFASEWRDDNENDRRIIEVLAGQPYEDVKAQLIELSKEIDPPIRNIRNNWQVISKLDFWFLIFQKNSQPLIDRLEEIIPTLFTDLDPAYDLPTDQRYMANINGSVPKHSGILKNGVADTLALLANFGDDCSRCLGSMSVIFSVKCWLTKLFKENNHVRFWFSLDSATRSFAEAAPDEFLEAVMDASLGSESEMQKLFQAGESDSFLGGGCYHCNLLWALESVSWGKQYLAQVSSCLARLSEIDVKDSNKSNRPFNTLIDIYLGWTNNSSVTNVEKLQIIEQVLLPKYPEISWQLMLNLLINRHQTTMGLSKPKYRDWALNAEKTITIADYYHYVQSIVDILLKEVDKDPAAKIIDLIGNFDSYTKEQAEVVLDKCLAIDEESLEEKKKLKLVEYLRDTISRHREFHDAEWSWEESVIDRLEVIYHKFEFPDVIGKNLFLFNCGQPSLIEPLSRKEYDYEERDKLLSKKRTEALEEILASEGKSGIVQLIEKSGLPSLVGNIAYSSDQSLVFEEFAFEWIAEVDNKRDFALGFLTPLAHKEFERAKEIFKGNEVWSPELKVQFLLCFPVTEATLDLVLYLESPAQESFWSQFYKLFHADNLNIKVKVIEQLNQFDRPLSAIDAMGGILYQKEQLPLVDPCLVTDILKNAISNPSELDRISINNISHDILKCIEFLQNAEGVSNDDLIFIEWQFIKLFDHHKETPKTLMSAVAEDPNFFSQLVAWMFKRDDKQEEDEELSLEQLQTRASNAWELLNTIRILPGQTGQEIDRNVLENWVLQARAKLSDIGREEIGNDQIGQYLSKSPNGRDDYWPHESVRHIIENYRNQGFEESLIIGKQNLRGVTSRHPYSGGGLERNLVELYVEAAQSMELVYPRTARLLRRLSESYEFQARRYDEDVELER